jgi:hypothetical protein
VLAGVTADIAVAGSSGDATATCALTSAATQNVPAGGSATFTWNCTTSGTGSVRFSGDAGNGSYDFVQALSNSVIVGPIGSTACTITPAGTQTGADVQYSYYIRNNGTTALTGLTVEDDVLGAIPGSPIASLAAGEEILLTATDFVDADVTNTVIVTAHNIPNCQATASATVTVEEPPPPPFGDCTTDITELSMVWNGNVDNVTVRAYYGNAGTSTLLATVTGVDRGETVKVGGYANSQNDVFWEIFSAAGAKLGTSTFHVSCSDGDMDGESGNSVQPQVAPYNNDCGKWEGNGKGTIANMLNAWILEGMVDADGVLKCNVMSTPGYTLPPPATVQ